MDNVRRKSMLGVKITVLLIVLTVIAKYIIEGLLANESIGRKWDMALGNNYPKYVYVLGVFVILDAIGIIYSVIWFLFLR
jgi:hypothetical protein